jgi:membrane protease YdiL (CAAX protease family)
MFSLAHMTPLLVPAYWAVFAAGILAGMLFGYRLGLRKTEPSSKNS